MEFVGVDGEGVNILHPDGSKEHRYVMLSVGDETLWNNGEELTYREIFPFLYEQLTAHPNAAFVGFFLGYDFSLMVKDLAESRARLLFNPVGIAERKRRSANPVPFPVYVDDWEIDMLGMRRFKLRPHIHDLHVKNEYPWLYVCDTGAYFQTAFLNVIEPTEKKWPTDKPCTVDEYETIKRGKENRATEIAEGDTSYYEEMVFYNRLENRVLARTMTILNQGFVAAGIKLSKSSFYGPGQAIQLWYDKEVKAGKYLAHKQLEQDIPDYVIEAFRASYYGGRFETPYIGHLPGITYEYDITSAYPHAMRNLPCLCSANWSQGDGTPLRNATILLCYGTFASSSQQVLGGLPFRNPRGNILYPTRTTGWYLWSEIDAGIEAGLIDTVQIERWIGFDQTCPHEPPLKAMKDLFTTRLTIGKQTPHGMAIKLMLNSGYGKFAQSIGVPKYGNPIYASMITSECRRMILAAIGTHPKKWRNVAMIATDGVYFTTPHPILDLLPDSEQLGGWEPGQKHNLTIMKPGVYWDDKTRAAVAAKEAPSIKSRGISAKALAANIFRLDQSFTDYYTSGLTSELPSLRIEIAFSIVSPRLALARGKWDTAGRVSWDDERKETASLAPKRTHPYINGPHIRTYAMPIPAGTVSTPYAKRFGFDPDDPFTEWGYDQEGEVSEVIKSLPRL